MSSGGHFMSGKRAIGIFVVFFVAQIVVGIGCGVVAGAYLAIKLGHADPAAISEAIVPLTVPIGMVGLVVAGLIALWMTHRTLPGPISKGAFAPLGWRQSPASIIAVAALAGGLVSLVYLLGLIPISPPAEGQEWGPLATAAESGGWPRVLWAFLALVLAPPIEEFVFRGVLLGGLSGSLGPRPAALVVSVLFVLVHVTEVLAYWPAWLGVSMLAFVAVVFRIRSESLLPAIAAHVGYNLVLVAAVCLGSA